MIGLTVGQKINGWTYLGTPPEAKPRYGLFRCDCGNEKFVFIPSVVRGGSCHCGICGRYKYNLSREDYRTLYSARIRAMNRCYDPHNPSYKRYGGRGITVCDEWRYNPPLFIKWAIENNWQRGLSLDRINNDLGYSPENCRWATPKMQANNRSACIYLEHDGMRKTLTEWSEYYGVPSFLPYNRLIRGEKDFESLFSKIDRGTGGVLNYNVRE